MDLSSIYPELASSFPYLNFLKNHPLAAYTTIKIGGPADIFVEVKDRSSLLDLLTYVHTHPALPFTLLGNGSNTLISDAGIRGLVVKNSVSSIEILGEAKNVAPVSPPHGAVRTENEPDKYLDFTKLDYDESAFPRAQVRLASGTLLPYALSYLLDRGITGLQWFAYIPASLGAAAAQNIHGGSHNFSEFLDSVEVFNLKTGLLDTIPASKLSWGYDASTFKSHPELIVLSVTLNLFKGDAQKAKSVAQAWIAQKAKVQPMNSLGSVFINPPLKRCVDLWGEQKSTGWIIDHALNLKGLVEGGASLGPEHANFIKNLGTATAQDYLNLIHQVQEAAKKQFDLDLEAEVTLLGDF